jgi:hypothetical protein
MNDIDEALGLITGILFAVSGLLVLLTRLEAALHAETVDTTSGGDSWSRRRQSQREDLGEED